MSKKRFRSAPALLMLMVALLACASPMGDNGNQPAPGQLATIVAMTLQAHTPKRADVPTTEPDAQAGLLPHSLYFLGRDNGSISHVYRMERDGKTATQLTFEPLNVTDYDVSLADGSIAYVASNQLLLANADGSNRRVLIDGGSSTDLRGFYNPVFSPGGQTLAYSRNGINLYDLSTGSSSLVLADRYGDVVNINGVERALPLETYVPEGYSPDGTKLLVHLLYTDTSSTAIYDPVGNTLVRLTGPEETLACCGLYRKIEWSADGSNFYAANPTPGFDGGGMWKVDAMTGAVTMIFPYFGGGMTNHLDEPYLGRDGQLYFFIARYSGDLAPLHRPPSELALVRSEPDGVTDRTILRQEENLRLMNEALWATDAGLVVVALAQNEEVRDGGQAEIVYFDGRPNVVLASFAQQMKWGP